ncbi:hypothetical protein RHSIM_Rhsim06G0024600 [Rhododendron simsii]|uniref:Protease Do-like PDZ domain-containing protein n=1 Tax=Rhododendron simsii TaxID=118357 RepID=A0A834GRT9_RHOSS|nr:hypothetical protein RHSIM_Rhsim06G0024600 [Rhododendron simsii]
MSSNSMIASLTPLLCKSKLSIIDERTIDTKNSFPSPANFPSRVISCSLSRYPSITLPKSCSVRYSVSSLGQNNMVDSNHGDEDEDEDEEKQNKSSYTKNINIRSLVDTVVKVFCVRAFQNYTCPWLMEEEESFRSGFIISGRRVLTSARAINLHMEVKLKRKNSDTWFTASVLALAYESDLAILTVNDDKFWEGVKPVDFGDMPAPKEKITVIGYPHMRDFVSVTESRVSRLGMTRYESWEASLLAFKVNVAGDEGKVGGPVFNTRGECVGLILQWIDDVTTVVPTEVIKHFIQDYDENGAHTGLPILAIKWQKMESFSLRVFMKMEPDQQGVLITEVNPNYPEFEVLKPYDVILSIDGININNDGTVPFKRGRRIEFSYLITRKYKGDKVAFRVLRDSKIHEFITELPTHKQFVPANTTGMPLPYYIIAGFVFTTLSVSYLQVVDERYLNWKIPDEDEVLSEALYEERVVLCKVLKGDITTGYEAEEEVQNQVIVAFNDRPVKGLKSLVSMVESCDEEFLKFTLENHKILVLRTSIARARTRDILNSYRIAGAMSYDLKE